MAENLPVRVASTVTRRGPLEGQRGDDDPLGGSEAGAVDDERSPVDDREPRRDRGAGHGDRDDARQGALP